MLGKLLWAAAAAVAAIIVGGCVYKLYKLTKAAIREWLLKKGQPLLEKLQRKLHDPKSRLSKGFRFVIEKSMGGKARGIIYGKRQDGSHVKIGEDPAMEISPDVDEQLSHGKHTEDYSAKEEDDLMAQMGMAS